MKRAAPAVEVGDVLAVPLGDGRLTLCRVLGTRQWLGGTHAMHTSHGGSMGALFVIRRRGATELFFGEHMEELALAVFARGPDYATTLARDLVRAHASEHVAAGFVIDHDARRALVLDTGPCFDAEVARASGLKLGTVTREAALGQLDLRDEERVLFEVMREGTTWEKWLDALRRAPLEDSWRGWALEWATPESFAREAASAAQRVGEGLPAAAPSTGAPASLFPEGAFHPAPAADAEKRSRYSACLARMEEPVLFTGLGPNASAVRLLVVPASGTPGVCRITKRGDAVTLDVARGAKAHRQQRRIGIESSWTQLLVRVARAGFWNLPTCDERVGPDGEHRVVEVLIDGRYHVVDRWSPQPGPFREVTLCLVRLTGWERAPR